MKEITGRETESALEEDGEHHNLLGVGCQDVLPFGRLPLKHHEIQEEVILSEFEDFSFVRDGLLEHVWMGGDHGEGKEDLR
jgi:hypothetical protein